LAFNFIDNLDYHHLSIPIFTDEKSNPLPNYRDIISFAIKEYEKQEINIKISRIVCFYSQDLNINIEEGIDSKSPTMKSQTNLDLDINPITHKLIKDGDNENQNIVKISLSLSKNKNSLKALPKMNHFGELPLQKRLNRSVF